MTARVDSNVRLGEGSANEVPPDTEVKRDLEVLLWSADLSLVRRFHRQPFWRSEGLRATVATWLERKRPLENVAEHSWKVADACMLLASRFPDLNVSRVVMIAIVHDKMELLTGDLSPIDRDGSGSSTHAFNLDAARRKIDQEKEAISRYASMLPPVIRKNQLDLLTEAVLAQTQEARFVATVDKIQALLFMLKKKGGILHPADYEFTLRYSKKAALLFPGLSSYFDVLLAEMRPRSRLGSPVDRAVARDSKSFRANFKPDPRRATATMGSNPSQCYVGTAPRDTLTEVKPIEGQPHI